MVVGIAECSPEGWDKFRAGRGFGFGLLGSLCSGCRGCDAAELTDKVPVARAPFCR